MAQYSLFLLVYLVICGLAVAITYYTKEELSEMKESQLQEVAKTSGVTQDKINEYLDQQVGKENFVGTVFDTLEESWHKEKLVWTWTDASRMEKLWGAGTKRTRDEFVANIAGNLAKYPNRPVKVCTDGKTECRNYNNICQAIAQESAKSEEDDDPMLYLNGMDNISLPREDIDRVWTVTYYRVIGHLREGGTFKIRIRYSTVRKLKARLGMSKERDAFTTDFPEPAMYDGLACRGKHPRDCEHIEKRRQQLKAWLNAIIKHVVKKSKEGTDDECNPYRARELRDFLTQVEEEAGTEQTQAMNQSLSESSNAIEERDKLTKQWREKMEGTTGCSISAPNRDSVEWVKSDNFLSMEDRCPNYGKLFGWWGDVGCPDKLSDIAKSITEATFPCIIGKGGLSGIPPIICDQYVMKTAKDSEVDPIYSLLYTLDKAKLPIDKLSTLLAPVCRIMKVTHPDPTDETKTKESYFTIVPNLMVKDVKRYVWSRRYDMKGNFNYEKKWASDDDFTLKDKNFWLKFSPDGLKIDGQQPHDGVSVTELVVRDSQILADLDHLDYSIFNHMVEIQNAYELTKIKEMHKSLPLVWGHHRGKTYAMTFGIIDLFMRNDVRSWGDRFGGAITTMLIDSCTPFDIDPIMPKLYRTRFGRMVGYHDPGPGSHAQDDKKDIIQETFLLPHHCGACYYRGPKAILKRTVYGKDVAEFTYFRSDYQEAQEKANTCEWTVEYKKRASDEL